MFLTAIAVLIVFLSFSDLPARTSSPAFSFVVRQLSSNEWMAHVREHPEQWEAGKTAAEAVGKLVITRKNQYDIPPAQTQETGRGWLATMPDLHTAYVAGASEWEAIGNLALVYYPHQTVVQ